MGNKNHTSPSYEDTAFSMTTDDYIAVIEAYGFKLLSSETVTVADRESPREESWYLYVKEDAGLFLYFDTYRGQRNSATVYYNWVAAEDIESHWELTSSGQFCDGLWCGSHDAREALCSKMDGLRSHGIFSKTPPHALRYWFNSYWEYPKGYDTDFDYGAITESKIEALPDKYKRMLGR